MPTLSGSLALTGSLNVTGSITLNGNQIISGSVTTTGPITSNGSPVITNTFSGSYATTGSNIFIGNQVITGSITSSGDLRFPNVGTGVVQPINLLTPTGTASYGSTLDTVSTNTTTYLEYGINIVATGSVGTGSYCCFLPQTPQKGKSVTIINSEGIDLIVFPSTAGGDINGQADGYFVVPPDGNSYTFNCYENPLPGGWSAINIPNGNTAYNTGIITYNASGNNQLSFINNTVKVLTPTLNNGAVFGGSSVVEVGLGTNPAYGNPFAYYIPTNVWKRINSISILTNVTGSFRYASTLTLSSQASWNVYFANTTNFAAGVGVFPPYDTILPMVSSWSQTNLGTDLISQGSNWSGTSNITQVFEGITTGTFTPVSGNPYISTGGVGAPGTMKMTWNINPNMVGSSIVKMVGKSYIGSAIGSFNGASQLYDTYWLHSFSPNIKVQGYENGSLVTNVNNIKFRMVLNVTPN